MLKIELGLHTKLISSPVKIGFNVEQIATQGFSVVLGSNDLYELPTKSLEKSKGWKGVNGAKIQNGRPARA